MTDMNYDSIGINIPYGAFKGASDELEIITPGTSSVSATADDIGTCMFIQNAGPALCFVRVGVGAQTATVNDILLQVGQDMVIGIPSHAVCTVAGITPSSSAFLLFQPGNIE